MQLLDLTGQRFGKLAVIKRAPNQGPWVMWRCMCTCGNESVVRGNSLRNGTRSCGCLHFAPETGAKIGASLATHGHKREGKPSPTYVSWQAMCQRCLIPKSSSYPMYGGRGITVCERWSKFTNFLVDMGERPSLKHQLHRIEGGTSDYEPGNVEWATAPHPPARPRHKPDRR